MAGISIAVHTILFSIEVSWPASEVPKKLEFQLVTKVEFQQEINREDNIFENQRPSKKIEQPAADDHDSEGTEKIVAVVSQLTTTSQMPKLKHTDISAFVSTLKVEPEIKHEYPNTAILAFNPGLKQRMLKQETKNRRKALLFSRMNAVNSMSEDHFYRQGASGEELKVGSYCFSLRRPNLMEAEVQWWRISCDTPPKNLFDLQPLEFDNKGRMIVD